MIRKIKKYWWAVLAIAATVLYFVFKSKNSLPHINIGVAEVPPPKPVPEDNFSYNDGQARQDIDWGVLLNQSWGVNNQSKEIPTAPYMYGKGANDIDWSKY